MSSFANTTAQALAINSLRKHGNLLFTNLDGKAITYREIEVNSNRVANGLRSLGIGRNDRVSVILPNSVEYATADFGIYKSGAALVPSNMMVNEGTIAFLLKDSSAKMVFAHASLAEKIKSMKPNLPSLGHIVVIEGATTKDWIGWDDFLAKYGETPLSPDASPDDDALIVYTGGTTGNPKGVLHSQGSLFFDIIAHDVELPFFSDDKILIMTPMSHATGWLLFSGGVKGTSFVFEKSFDPLRVLEVIQKERATLTMMVPTIIYVFLDILKQNQYDLSSLRMIGYGAAPISEARLAEAMERFGPIFLQKYGLVECPNMICTLSKNDHLRALEKPEILQSCGRPDVMVTLKIVDEEGKEVPTGQVGEIIVKAPYVMKSYINLDEMTKETLEDGWLHTGDMGRVDEEGYVYIVDRKRDMVISGGMNVFPAEVEAVVRTHPRVKDVSVIGVPDDYWGEAVTACVVADGQVSGEEIIAFCKGKVAKYCVPKKVVFMDQLPKTIIGKIDKKALREPYWKGRERKVV
jgi:fatty-acyl-CoA synthase